MNEPLAAPLPRRSDGRLAGWASLVGALTILNYAGNLLTADENDDRDAVYTWEFAIGGAVQFTLMLAIVLAIARGPRMRDLLGLRPPASVAAALGLSFAVLVGVYIVLVALSPLLDPGGEQGIVPEDWDSARVAQFAVNAALIAGYVPIVEELTFRGAGVGLLDRFGQGWAIAITGFAFALAHGLVEALPAFVAFGCGLAYLRYRTRSVFPCVLVHGVFNAIALAVSVST